MLSQRQIECLLACNACAASCLQCASACLKEEDPRHMVRCIALDFECADICRLAATSIAFSGTHMNSVCKLCADMCEACATECAKHPMDHCQQCAESCKRCVDACREMAS